MHERLLDDHVKHKVPATTTSLRVNQRRVDCGVRREDGSLAAGIEERCGSCKEWSFARRTARHEGANMESLGNGEFGEEFKRSSR